MPIYVVKCDACGQEQDIYRTVAEIDDLPDCCGVKTHRVIQASMVASDIQPYQSMIDGSMITSRSKHKAHLKQNGCIEIGNETKYLKPPKREAPPGLKQTLIDVVHNGKR